MQWEVIAMASQVRNKNKYLKSSNQPAMTATAHYKNSNAWSMATVLWHQQMLLCCFDVSFQILFYFLLVVCCQLLVHCTALPYAVLCCCNADTS